MEIDNMRKPTTNPKIAVKWGQWLAAHLRDRGETNPFLLAAQFGWRVILEHEEEACLPAPLRLAEWDGSRRMIRIFVPILRRHLGDSESALHRACAHELFHGLAAHRYRALQIPAQKPLRAAMIPGLNDRDEETAAQAFSEALLLEIKSCPPSASR
jgi:hypothetical protein